MHVAENRYFTPYCAQKKDFRELRTLNEMLQQKDYMAATFVLLNCSFDPKVAKLPRFQTFVKNLESSYQRDNIALGRNQFHVKRNLTEWKDHKKEWIDKLERVFAQCRLKEQ